MKTDRKSFIKIAGVEGAFKKAHKQLFNMSGYDRMWPLKEFQHGNGNQYSTHGLGPVCQAMDINRGDKMDYLTSMQSNDFQFGKMAAEFAKKR